MSTCFPASTSTTKASLWPAVRGLRTHTTALFASTPLLLCEEVIGYSATPVPFSSFLRGFLGAGVGKAKEGEAGTSISYQWLVILPSQLPHQALVQVSFLGALVLVVLCYRVTIYCVRQPWHSE